MDPATAIGTASAILSFIEFSWGLVAGAKEIYDSADGTSRYNANIREMTSNLQGLTESLEAGVLGNSKPEHDLRRLISDCNALSNELMAMLQKLQGTGSFLDAIKVKFRSMRKKDEISSVRGRLAEYTSQLTTTIGIILLNQQSGVKSQLDSMQMDDLQSATATVQRLEAIRELLTTSLATAQQNIADLHGKADASRDVITQQAAVLHQIKTNLDSFRDVMRIIPLEERILKHIFYKSMFDREDAIRDAEKGTFAWLLGEQDADSSIKQKRMVPSSAETSSERKITGSSGARSASGQKEEDGEEGYDDLGFGSNIGEVDLQRFERSQKNQRHLATDKLIAWLQHGSGVFHLSGKPGSGKSTAMKLIVHHERTRALLESWAGNKCLVTSDHYFWSTGDRMQTSLEGLYRSILYNILRQCPGLIPDALPEQWAALRADTRGGPDRHGSIDVEESWFRASKIKEAFKRLMALKQLDNIYHICLFVDGLDEFQGDPLEHRQLAQSFSRWSQRPNVKCLLSSRPYLEFHQVFPEDTRLRLHQLNERDIYTFALQMFERDINIKRMRPFYKALVCDVVQGSEGVFIWAFLVIRILLGSAGYDSRETLFQKLRSLPKELGDVYQRLLESLGSLDRERANKMLRLALYDVGEARPLSSLAYGWVHLLEDPTFPFQNTYSRSSQQLTELYDRIEQQIASTTKGLLEIGSGEIYRMNVGEEHPEFLRRKVQFMHRSVADYLKCSGVLATCESAFDVAQSHARLKLAELAALEVYSHSDRRMLYNTEMLYNTGMMFMESRRGFGISVGPFPYDIMDRMVTEMPVTLAPASLCLNTYELPILSPEGRETDEGQTLSIPHFLVFLGLTDYVLSRPPPVRPRASSQVPDLNLLLSWVCLPRNGRIDKSAGTPQLLSHGSHFKDKVQFHTVKFQVPDSAGLVTNSSTTGTVWILFVVMLWQSAVQFLLSGIVGEESAEHYLEALPVFLDNGADLDVFISFRVAENHLDVLKDLSGVPLRYMSMVDIMRVLYDHKPHVFNHEWPGWEELLSKKDSSPCSLPTWACKIPGADPEARMIEVVELSSLLGRKDNPVEIIPYNFCSREECIPAILKFRIY